MVEFEILSPAHHVQPISSPMIFEARGEATFAYVPGRAGDCHVVLPLGHGLLVSWWRTPELGGVVVNFLTDEPRPRMPFLEVGQSIALTRTQLRGAIAMLQSIDEQLGDE